MKKLRRVHAAAGKSLTINRKNSANEKALAVKNEALVITTEAGVMITPQTGDRKEPKGEKKGIITTTVMKGINVQQNI